MTVIKCTHFPCRFLPPVEVEITVTFGGSDVERVLVMNISVRWGADSSRAACNAMPRAAQRGADALALHSSN